MKKTFAYRNELPRGGQSFTGLAAVDNQTLKEIKCYDSRFELIEIDQQVHIYRVKLFGAAPSEDQLVYQCSLPKHIKVGHWIVDRMKENDEWQKHGSGEASLKDYLRADGS
jgi:hypothetical protein